MRRPVVIDLPLVAPNSSLGGPWVPDALSREELAAFLETPLPADADVAAGDTLWAVLQHASGKVIVWGSGGADASASKLKVEPFRGRFREPRYRTFRDALAVLMEMATREGIGFEEDPDYMYRDFVLVTRGQIIIVSLPVGKWPPLPTLSP